MASMALGTHKLFTTLDETEETHVNESSASI